MEDSAVRQWRSSPDLEKQFQPERSGERPSIRHPYHPLPRSLRYLGNERKSRLFCIYSLGLDALLEISGLEHRHVML